MSTAPRVSGRALTVVRGACPHDCPDTCAWEVTVDGDRAIGLRGVKDHPLTQGRLCAKVNHYLERAYSPDRLLHPLRRVGAKGERRFEQIGWDAALDAIAGRLGEIVAEHGGEAVLPYSYMGTQGIVQGASIDRRFFSRIGATRLTRGICGSSAAAGYAATQGSTKGMLPEDLRHSRFIVLWGTNTIVTNLHLWPFVTEARQNGARVVVIDPVETRTARSADWHVRPLPGTDAALALGLMHVIVAEGLHDAEYVERHAVGFEELRGRLEEYPPERVASITGLAEEEIVELARAYATTRPQAIRTLIGMGHRERGGMTIRTIACLPVLVGAWRELGGGIVGTTAWAAWSPLNLEPVDSFRPSGLDHPRGEHGAARTRAHGARAADPRARGLQREPRRDRARPGPRARRAAARRPVHGRDRAVPHRHRRLRRRRAARDDPARAPRPGAVVGERLRDAQPAGDRAAG